MRMRLAIAVAFAGLLPLAAAAQQKPASPGTPNAMQGFSRNKGQPVKIEAATLEVRDKDKMATFSGDVRVTQGDTTLKTKTLIVYYEGDKPGVPDAKAMRSTQSLGPAGEQKIKKLEAHGGVVVTQADQIASGDNASFDMATNMVTMNGNVVLTQGQNVLRGQKLVVDMSNGFSRIESSAGGNGRVQGLFVPSGERPSLPGQAPPGNRPAPAPKPGSN